MPPCRSNVIAAGLNNYPPSFTAFHSLSDMCQLLICSPICCQLLIFSIVDNLSFPASFSPRIAPIQETTQQWFVGFYTKPSKSGRHSLCMLRCLYIPPPVLVFRRTSLFIPALWLRGCQRAASSVLWMFVYVCVNTCKSISCRCFGQVSVHLQWCLLTLTK